MSLHTVAARILNGVASRIQPRPGSQAPQRTAEKPSRLERFVHGTLGVLNEVKAAGSQAAGGHGVFSVPSILQAPARPRTFSPLLAPPFTLQQYVGLKGPSPRYAHYLAALERQVASRSLQKLTPAIQPANRFAKGPSKDYYQCGPRYVVGLVERAGRSVAQDSVLMTLLQRSGLPVAASRVGTMDSAFRGTPPVRTGAVVTERLTGCLHFERMTPGQRRDFLASGNLNETTLNSLEALRRTMSQQRIDIAGLKGGIRRDGTFVLRAPSGISRHDPRDPVAARARANLDRLIEAVRLRLDGGHRPAARRA